MAKKAVNKSKSTKKSHPPVADDKNAKTWGWIFVGLGVFFLLRDAVGFDLGQAWPVILILIGAYLLWYRDKR